MTPQDRAAEARQRVLAQTLSHVDAQSPLLVLKAPPGSGKTYIVAHALALAFHRRLRVAVATHTNAQADELCERMARDFPTVRVIRWSANDAPARSFGGSVTQESDSERVQADRRCVVVATTSKWATSNAPGTFDVLIADEAWQMAWSDFLSLRKLAGRFVLVGDPGQIAPVVAVDVARWETTIRPPHRAAPEVILADRHLHPTVLELPVTTRLPHDTAELVRGFYDFDFSSWALPGDRFLELERARTPDAIDVSLNQLQHGSVSLHTLPTPAAGPPLEDDKEVALATVELVRRLLSRGGVAYLDGQRLVVTADQIGITATHRAMNMRIADTLGNLSNTVRVDTPERWQGLERLVMIAVHPLSGVLRPSPFDLDTGRLCVMASRHRVGLLVVSRDHVGDTLAQYAPTADQAVARPDEAGRGHVRNLEAWRWMRSRSLQVPNKSTAVHQKQARAGRRGGHDPLSDAQGDVCGD